MTHPNVLLTPDQERELERAIAARERLVLQQRLDIQEALLVELRDRIRALEARLPALP